MTDKRHAIVGGGGDCPARWPLWLTLALVLVGAVESGAQPFPDRVFTLTSDAEVVAGITAGCARCDWAIAGREAAVLVLSIDGGYSQHLVLARGEPPSEYRVMLGSLRAGIHRLRIVRDEIRSAPGAGTVTIGPIAIEPYADGAPEYPWLSRAPMLGARPGSVERFSDLPLLMYAESNVPGESGGRYLYQYTAIFTNEDGGTPADRLMATWGRTTDIEFVYGVGADGREEIQAAGHQWVPFSGSRAGTHPILWVATDNNMVSDRGPEASIRLAPAPEMAVLDRVSREAVMDRHPWTYAVTSAEMVREARIDDAAAAGSGRLPDPRRYITIEGCGDVVEATLAFDVGVRRGTTGGIEWYSTDRGDARFRVARGGCFRSGAPLAAGAAPADVVALRVRAYPGPPREGEAALPPGSGRVVLERINRVFMLDSRFVPTPVPIQWLGTLTIATDGVPVGVPLERR